MQHSFPSVSIYLSIYPLLFFLGKWGLKTYCLCDSKNGYLHNMAPYTGESNDLDSTVTGLLGDLSSKGYHLYMDNFYNQVERTEMLRSSGTHVCGTLRRHRGEPLVLNKIVRHKDGVMVLYWRNKKIVRMVNTIHPHDTITIKERKKGKGAQMFEKQKPVCVHQSDRQRKSTTWMCSKCQVALCVECFFVWHTIPVLPKVREREDGE